MLSEAKRWRKLLKTVQPDRVQGGLDPFRGYGYIAIWIGNEKYYPFTGDSQVIDKRLKSMCWFRR